MIPDIPESRYSTVAGPAAASGNIGGWKFPWKEREDDAVAASAAEALLVKVRVVMREELGAVMMIQQVKRFASEYRAEARAEGLPSGIHELSGSVEAIGEQGLIMVHHR